MAHQQHPSPSELDDDDDGKALRNAVFIDTTLDTHLAIIVSRADTVSDLKKRIMFEHPLCFPKIGQIQIHAIKVKRKGYFYHLSDSMLVRNAFDGFNKSWFLTVDASTIMDHEKNKISNSPSSSNQVVCHGIAKNALMDAIDIPLSCPSKGVSEFNRSKLLHIENIQDEKEGVPSVSPCVSEQSEKGVVKNLETGVKPSGNGDDVTSSPGSFPKTKDHELPSLPTECEVDGFSKGNKDENSIFDEGTLKSMPSVKKKNKHIWKKEDTVKSDAFEDNNTSVLGPGKLTVQQDILVPENPSGDASRGFSHGTGNGENDIAAELGWRSTKISRISSEALKATEVPEEHTELNNNNSKNIDAECYKSTNEASEPGSPKNKKHKKRKRSLTHDIKDEMLKVESTSEKAEVHMSNKVQKKSEETLKQVEFNSDKCGDGFEFQQDNVSQEPSDTRSPAKKKQKRKGRGVDECALKEKQSMINDPNKETTEPENASMHSLDEQPKSRNRSADQLTDYFDDADLVRTTVPSSKKKKKKNSSKHQTAEHSNLKNHGEIMEEILEDGQISKGTSVSKITGDNMEIEEDAFKEGSMSKGNSEDHCAIDEKVYTSDLNESKELTGDKTGEIEQTEEAREITVLDGSKLLLSENCTPSNQRDTDANIRELTVTSEVLEATETTEHGKSEKKRKKKRNAKDSGDGPAVTEGLSCVDASASNCDPISENTKTVENLLNQIEGENLPLKEMEGIPLSATDGEVDDINAGSLENINKTEAHTENLRDKKGKKSKKKQTTTARSASEMPTNDQFLDHKEPSLTSDCRLLEEPSSKIRKKNKSLSMKSTDKSSGPILEPERGIETPHPLSNDTPLDSKRSSRDEDNNHLESPSRTDNINAEQHFVSEQRQHMDIVSDDILIKKDGANKTDIDLMTGKNRNRLEVVKGNTHIGTTPVKKVPKAHRIVQEAQLSSQSKSVTSTIEQNRRPQAHKASGKIMKLGKKGEAFAVSNSNLKGSKKMVQNRVGKAFGNSIEGDLSKKEKRKSLLAGTIFNDDSSGTSEDEDEKANDSNSSTQSPSDNSLSSEYSDGDSHAGSPDRKGQETSGRSSAKSRLSGTEGISFESILRSSRRYKKAKMTASQLEETESQPVDFVPDSLADP